MLSVQGVQLSTEQSVLVNGVSLQIGAGESVALMGASGSGKSLTAMALAGLLPLNIRQTQGHIDIQRGRPALIMQNPADCFDPLFRMRSVFHETFCAHMAKKTLPDFIENVLRLVGFTQPDAILQSYPFELSGGMLHRCMIALAVGMVLAGKTACIIADEPLSGLDAPSKHYMLGLLKRLQQEYGFALLYIDHDLASAAQVAQKVVVMHAGHVVEQGLFAEVIQNPQHAVTQQLVQAYNRLQEMHSVTGDTASACAQPCSPQEACADVVHVEVQDAPQQNAAAKEVLLRACHVSKSYAGKPVLQDVHVELFAGQSLGLVGANGAGKSTLIRILLGLENADAGHVFCGEHAIVKTHAKTAWRKDLQAVFQHARLAVNPRLQAHDILLEPIRANAHVLQLQGKEAEKAKVQELLALVDLPQTFASKYPIHMSGGQLQRLCLARALALQPKIVLLDESLADLDAVVSEQIQEKLQELKRHLGLSFLYISHDIRSVLRLCEQVMVLHEGRIVDTFQQKEFLHMQRHVAFKALLCTEEKV